jgi:transposase InsO family protein
VRRATLPLQYVFSDHCLLKVFTVDEATRSRLDRLWLTLLIDAYSRAILGMALLCEAPCIESIQGALRHAIWPKTSHRDLGIPAPAAVRMTTISSAS